MVHNGKNLNIIIYCSSNYYYHWMSLCCYLNLYKFLPNANFTIVTENTPNFYFSWARQLKIKIVYFSKIPEPSKLVNKNRIVLNPHYFLIKPLSKDLFIDHGWHDIDKGLFINDKPNFLLENLCSYSKEELDTYFINIKNGFSNFDPKFWLDKNICFLSMIHNYKKSNNINDLLIIKDWQRAIQISLGLGLVLDY